MIQKITAEQARAVADTKPNNLDALLESAYGMIKTNMDGGAYQTAVSYDRFSDELASKAASQLQDDGYSVAIDGPTRSIVVSWKR